MHVIESVTLKVPSDFTSNYLASNEELSILLWSSGQLNLLWNIDVIMVEYVSNFSSSTKDTTYAQVSEMLESSAHRVEKLQMVCKLSTQSSEWMLSSLEQMLATMVHTSWIQLR